MLLFIINNILLGVGLAMDAFSLSLANGLHQPHMKKATVIKIASVFGIFQGVMPMLGWICIHTIASYFNWFEKITPWISLILLVYLGGKMIYESISGSNQDEEYDDLAGKVLLIQGIATSIDALSVGFTIVEYSLLMAISSALIIAIVTFGICMIGLLIGKKVGNKFAGKANIMGGIILIAIGLEIFISSFL